jgi:uncharacterized membrane protein
MTDISQSWPKKEVDKQMNVLSRTDLPTILALFIVGTFVICIITVFFVKLPSDQVTLGVVTTLLGVLVSNVNQIVSYYFGSSAGSKKKDDALADAVATTNTQANTQAITQGIKP